MSAEDDAGGYGKPPATGRFAKGTSGNLRTDLEAELKEMIQIREGDRSARVTKQRGPGLLGIGVLDHLGLIQNDMALACLREKRDAQQRSIAGDDQIDPGKLLRRQQPHLFCRHRRGMDDLRLQAGRKSLDLGHRVGEQ